MVCWSKNTCFQYKRENWLDFCVGGPNWLDFSVWERIWLDFSVVMKLISLLCGWSKLNWVLYAGRKPLAFSVSIQIDLTIVWVVQIDLISVWGVELYLISVQSEMDWVVVWIVENGIISVWWVGIDLVFVQRSKMTWFQRCLLYTSPSPRDQA